MHKIVLSLNRRILIVCGASIIWIILYKFLFIKIEPIFPKAAETGEIVFNLLSSVIASGIFYYFVVYLEQRRIAKTLFPTINKRLQTFGVGLYLIKSDLYKLKSLEVPNELPDLEEFEKICEGIVLTSKPPEILGNPSYLPADWFEYFEYFFQSDKFLSNQLYTHIGFLTPDILRELDEIQYSQFQRALDVYRINRRFDKLSGASGPLWLYLNSLKKISSISLK